MNRRRLLAFGAVGAGIVGFASMVAVGTRTGTDANQKHPAAEVERGLRGRHEIALTFDAGGGNHGIADLLAALDAAGVKSTFFLTGQWACENPEWVRDISKRGHEIGNHTWSHPDMTTLHPAAQQSEIERTESILTQLLGRRTNRHWRAPFGARNAQVLKTVETLRFTSIYWTLDSLDSVEPPKTPDFLRSRIVHQSDEQLDGAIILMHVGEPSTAQALPGILGNLHQRGFKPVTISRLLEPHGTRQTANAPAPSVSSHD